MGFNPQSAIRNPQLASPFCIDILQEFHIRNIFLNPVLKALDNLEPFC